MKTRQQSNKLPFTYENPIDYIFEEISYFLGPHFYKNKYTPNMITTLSFIFGFIAIYSLYHKKYILAALFHIISYLFDCLDGNYARTYNLETKFGDLYDHLKDTIYAIVLAYVLIIRNNHNKKNKLIIYSIMIILIFISLIFFGCTEIYISKYRKDLLHSNTLSTLSKMCPSKPTKFMNKFKYFSIGTLNLFVFIVILSFYFNEQTNTH